MKKLILSGLLALSMNSLSASSTIDTICKYDISKYELNALLNGVDPKFNAAYKAIYLAKHAAYYDMGYIGYLKSFWAGTTEYNRLCDLEQIENQLRDRQAILQNNTWEAWGWSAAKYSAVILATYYLTRSSLTFNIH